MKITIRIIQVIVALLFIVSGLIKANDPLGLAYKMEEFFELWISDLNNGSFFAKGALVSLFKFLNQHTLFLSVTMITLEIVTGVALLVGWMKRLMLWLLFVLIVFFSFLTGYAYLSGKFTNCGCFGDCIPITPFTSFVKDLALTAMIVFLLLGQKYIQPLFSRRIRALVVMGTLALSLLLQWYVLRFLPLVDCLPMKKGNNISEQIKPPKNAVPSVYETRLVYQNSKSNEIKDMSQDEFNNSKIWEDSNWKWKETKTKLVRQGTDIPKLQNFVLSTLSGYDSTEAILNHPGYTVLYFVNTDKNGKGIDQEFLKAAGSAQFPVYFVTTNPGSFMDNPGFPVFTCDGTVFRIAARVDPTIYLLKQAKIINKWPLARIDDATKTISELKQ
jgi:hypothetical protein